jgi:hypothetical protein
MQRLPLSLMLTAFTLTSCAAWPQLEGDYKDRLTYNDVLEIRALVQHRPELRPIYRICMYWPDRALVETGNVVNTGDITTSFIARRKNGHWTIDETSVEKNLTIITSDSKSFTHWPNQAMQPTARRRTASLLMTKELSFQASLAPTSGG